MFSGGRNDYRGQKTFISVGRQLTVLSSDVILLTNKEAHSLGLHARGGEYQERTFAPGDAFAIGDLEHACPGVSRATIRRVLEELRTRGQVKCLGRGRAAQWRRL